MSITVTESLAQEHVPNSQVVSPVREPLVTGGKTVHDVTVDVCRQVEAKPPKSWLLALAISLGVLAVGAYAVFMLVWEGIGVWGLNKTVGWAWDITNFVVGGYRTCWDTDFRHFVVV